MLSFPGQRQAKCLGKIQFCQLKVFIFFFFFKIINRKSARMQLNVGGAEDGKCLNVSPLRTESIQMYHRLDSCSDPAPLIVIGACLLLVHRSPPYSIRINVPALSNTQVKVSKAAAVCLLKWPSPFPF